MGERMYAAIDLKSFYASVECLERGMEPLEVNLVVADAARTDKTICLAVSPALKSFGIPGRPRLFEVISMVNRLNRIRGFEAEGFEQIRAYNEVYAMGMEEGGCSDKGKQDAEDIYKSMCLSELRRDKHRKIRFIIARPRMALYVDYSMRIYNIYLNYISPEDIFAYSIDEVFIDLTPYRKIYGLSPRELVQKMLLDVYQGTGITATAGIGTNLYLAKIAMDIVAKHSDADENGTRMAFLDEYIFRHTLWDHLPLTDFWSIGRGTAKRLHEHGLYTIGDIARCSIGDDREYYNEKLLYRLFGVNAELLIDHAWGIEPVTLKEIKNYRPKSKSLSSGQVLIEPYTYEKARVVIVEMAEKMALSLMEKNCMASQLVIGVGYDVSNVKGQEFQKEIAVDRYGRARPKHAHGSILLTPPTDAANRLIESTLAIYDRIVDRSLWIRRMHIAATKIEQKAETSSKQEGFADMLDYLNHLESKDKEGRDANLQAAVLKIKKKYGRNAILRGYSFLEGATGKSRNKQIGGHLA